MSVQEVIDTFNEFFTGRGHRLVTGTSLKPPLGDPVLFTTSGMHPLTPYLVGEPHPLGRRLYGIQRCLRTTDLDEVGDYSHLTVFQMLGSWSLGDYQGPQSLRWGYELITSGFGIEPGRLRATVFGGDSQVGTDNENLHTWTALGLPVELTTEHNWWSNGPTGPCGPDSEVFVWTGDGPPQGTPTTDDRWLELWNHVMMRYDRQEDGSLEPLPQRSIDTGMGLERLLMVLQEVPSVFDTDLFRPWRETLLGRWTLDQRPGRIVTDHLRSSIVIIGDGVLPSNTGRGYVLRRLLRRVLTTLWRDDPDRTLRDLPDSLVDHTLDWFGQDSVTGMVREVLGTEERRFGELLSRGRKVLDRQGLRPGQQPTEDDLRYLHETHGLPPELVTDLLATSVEPAA